MDLKIIETANKYKDLALMLDSFELERPIDEDAPDDVQAALIKLYYAKAFEVEIEKCEDLLDEYTEEETVNAVGDAANTIETAYESAFRDIEEYYFKDKELAERIDGVTVNTEAEGLFVKLIKLYKCEGIIRSAYNFPIKNPHAGTGLRGLFSMQEQEQDVPMSAEENIKLRLGIDICELAELRQRLIDEISCVIKGNKML